MQDRYPDSSAFSIRDMVRHAGDRLGLRCLTGTPGLERLLTSPDISRPGLCLTGYTHKFLSHRIQIFGETEITMLEDMNPGARRLALANVFSFPVVCSVVSKGLQPPQELLDASLESGSPLFVSPRDTTPLINDLTGFLRDVFAPRETMHGTLVDVFGEGILCVGRSAIGKSEAVLGLVERGHRLIADDTVSVRRNGDILVGSGDPMIGYHMELRGLGFVNVPELFGVGAVKDRQQIDLVVRLVDADRMGEMDRSGLETMTTDILGLKVPLVEIPVLPGRNLTILLEVAAMLNIRRRNTGSSSSEQLNRTLLEKLQQRRGPE
jgi:HPr kinase/phosphorylase